MDNGSPLSAPARPDDLQSALEAIGRLEAELEDFQTSSYELEKELEKELDGLEAENEQLKRRVETAQLDLEVVKEEKHQLARNSQAERQRLVQRVRALEQELESKRQQLVETEIQNDDFQQHERNLESEYRDALENYEHSEERGVLLESELAALKEELARERLQHQNTRNELEQCKREHLKKETTVTVEERNKRRMSRSNSLRQLHSMLSQTNEMEVKLETIKNSLQVQEKTTPTTGVSHVGVMLSTEGIKAKKERKWWHRDSMKILSHTKSGPKNKIPVSQSSLMLSTLASKSSLEPIEGSPNKDRKPQQAGSASG